MAYISTVLKLHMEKAGDYCKTTAKKLGLPQTHCTITDSTDGVDNLQVASNLFTRNLGVGAKPGPSDPSDARSDKDRGPLWCDAKHFYQPHPCIADPSVRNIMRAGGAAAMAGSVPVLVGGIQLGLLAGSFAYMGVPLSDNSIQICLFSGAIGVAGTGAAGLLAAYQIANAAGGSQDVTRRFWENVSGYIALIPVAYAAKVIDPSWLYSRQLRPNAPAMHAHQG